MYLLINLGESYHTSSDDGIAGRRTTENVGSSFGNGGTSVLLGVPSETEELFLTATLCDNLTSDFIPFWAKQTSDFIPSLAKRASDFIPSA